MCEATASVLMSCRNIVAGMDACEMDESLHEAQWKGEEDYHPFNRNLQLS